MVILQIVDNMPEGRPDVGVNEVDYLLGLRSETLNVEIGVQEDCANLRAASKLVISSLAFDKESIFCCISELTVINSSLTDCCSSLEVSSSSFVLCPLLR